MLKEKPLLLWHIERLLEQCDQIVVVLGAHLHQYQQLLAKHPQIEWTVNEDWASTHQIDSLRCGLQSIAADASVLVTPVDTPPSSPALLKSLCEAEGDAVVPVNRQGVRGHPVLLRQVLKKMIINTDLPLGLASVLDGATQVFTTDPDVAIDFDTPKEWQQFISRWTI